MAKTKYEGSKGAIMRYQKESVAYIKIGMKSEEKQKWQSAADSAGMPLATLIRKLMNDYMNK